LEVWKTYLNYIFVIVNVMCSEWRVQLFSNLATTAESGCIITSIKLHFILFFCFHFRCQYCAY